TIFKGNEMQTHFNGLYLNTGSNNFATVIGYQPHHGNRWYGPFKSFGAINLASFPFIPLSRFDVDTSLGSVYNPIVWATNTWFAPFDTGNTFYCNSSLVCSTIPPPTPDSVLNERIADGTFDSEDFSDESRAIAEEYLYRELE